LTDPLDAYIKQSVIKDRLLLVSIFQDIATKHKDETKRQHLIRAAVAMFEAQHPAEVARHQNKIRTKRELLQNQFGANWETELQLMFLIPPYVGTAFFQVSEKLNDKTLKVPFMSDEAQKLFNEHDWFKKNFPQFVVPEKL
jgi:hypothetical protein